MDENLDWLGYDLSHEGTYAKVIKKLEFLIRRSFQYDVWQKRSKIGVTTCPICEGEMHFLKPESHHYPQTLFDIVDSCLQDHIYKNDLDELDEFDICKEIMNKHLTNQVEWVVLCKQCHEKFHDNVPSVVEAMPEAYKIQKEKREEYFNKTYGGTQ